MLDHPEGAIPKRPGKPPRARDRAGPRRPVVARKPQVGHLAVDAYAIFDHADPDRAGPWINECEPDDPDAAYFLELYESCAQAQAAIRSRAEHIASEIYPRNPDRAENVVEDIQGELTVRRITTRSDTRGRDYRFSGCDELPEALTQIRSGKRNEHAWREILRQRAVEDVHGARLPGPTNAGMLFIFITADALEISAPL